MSSVKQVIVMRKDLNMRRGKQISQGAHASMKVLLDMCKTGHYFDGDHECVDYTFSVPYQGPIHEWLSNAFTKICVSVNSEAELLEIVDKAQTMGIPVALITDNGATEFNGVKTNTCAALGPWHSETIDILTGHLKLL